jgi:hypothetical protein
MMMAVMISLCVLVSTICAGLLLRAFFQNKSGLLFWSSMCFTGLAVENCILFVDLVLLPTEPDLSVMRNVTAVLALCCLTYGFLWRGTE